MICFGWLGFPQYGARCVRAFVRSTKERVVVVASRPDVPIRGMDEIAECEVVWVKPDETRGIAEILGEMPRVMTIPGWKFPLFNRFRDEVRAAGGRVVCLSDNNFQLNWKECIKAVLVRFKYEKLYDMFWVPSFSGRKLMRFYGVPEKKITMGCYSIDASLFTNGLSAPKRPRRLLFVGQFVDRKNVLRLCEAFLAAEKQINGGWQLEMCGCGTRKGDLCRIADKANRAAGRDVIVVHDFVQPEQLAGMYQNARAFVIPSVEDHWPLVMHESVLSGCILLTSNRCGDMVDFLEEGVNGYSFSPFSVRQMKDAIAKVMSMNVDQQIKAQEKSLELAHRVSLDTFVRSATSIFGNA